MSRIPDPADAANDAAAAMPHNASKPQEHGFANGLAPRAGQTVHAPRSATASTLSEESHNAKTGGRWTACAWTRRASR
jgi:hypothetical protein